MLETHQTLPDTPKGKGDAKVIVVMPARNAAKTLEATVSGIPRAWVAGDGVKSLGAGARLVLHRRGVWRSKKFQA